MTSSPAPAQRRRRPPVVAPTIRDAEITAADHVLVMLVPLSRRQYELRGVAKRHARDVVTHAFRFERRLDTNFNSIF